MNKTEWNLGEGIVNVCKSIINKLDYAGFQTEDRPRTIINLDSYEITVLYWAMQDYIQNKIKSTAAEQEKKT